MEGIVEELYKELEDALAQLEADIPPLDYPDEEDVLSAGE